MRLRVLRVMRLMVSKSTEGVVGQVESTEKDDGCENLLVERLVSETCTFVRL